MSYVIISMGGYLNLNILWYKLKIDDSIETIRDIVYFFPVLVSFKKLSDLFDLFITCLFFLNFVKFKLKYCACTYVTNLKITILRNIPNKL